MKIRSKTNEKRKYLCTYTAVFLVFCFFISIPFLKEHVVMINSKDCLKQHYPAFVYLGQYIRSIIKTILSSGTLTIPAWDWNLGYGSDILTTLNYYSFGDPLNLISVLVPTRFSAAAFQVVIYLRLYLAGLTFSWFCWDKQKNRFAVLIGTLIYIFSAYGLHSSTGHVFFVNALIYLPIFFIAIDKLLSQKKTGLLTGITVLSCISNFYFFYMLSIMAGAYLIIGFIKTNGRVFNKNTVLLFFKKGICFLIAYLKGICCSAIIFFPILVAFKNNAQTSVGKINLLHYTLEDYTKLFTGIFGHFANKLGGGFAGLTLIIFAIIIVERKKYKSALWGIAGIFLMQCLPVIGWMFNGFSYVADRWVFLVDFYLAFVAVKVFPEILCIKDKKIYKQIFKLLLIYITAAAAARFLMNLQLADLGLTFISCIFTIAVLAFGHRKWNYQKVTIFLLGIMLVNVSLSFRLYTEDRLEENFFTSVKEIKNVLRMSSLPNTYDMKPGEKVDVLSPNILNYSIFNHYGSTSSYWSMGDKGVSEYQDLLLNQKRAVTNIISGYDSRTVLNTLNNVKYVIVRDPYYEKIPFGYKLVETYYNKKTKKTERIYENKYFLSPAYVYGKNMTRENWLKLSPLEREEVMMDTVIIDSKQQNLEENDERVLLKQWNYSGKKFVSKIKEANYGNKDVVIKNNKFIIKKNKTIVRVPVTSHMRTENYMYFKNFSYTPIKNSTPQAETPIAFWFCGVGSYYNFANNYSRYHPDRDDFYVNLGYTQKEDNELLIDFRIKGIYKFDQLKFISKDMGHYKDRVISLRNNSVKNINVKGNTITLKKKSNQKEMLYINIPYSSGWKAFVNGKETEVNRANIMGMGIMLTQNENNIVLKYITPGFRAGAVTSMFTILLIILQHLISNKHLKKISGGKDANKS